MLANNICRDSYSATATDNRVFSKLPHHALRPLRCGMAEGRRLCGTPWFTRNIDVTQNVYAKSWWEERVDALTQAVEAITDAAKCRERKEKDQAESVSNE